MEDEDVRDVQVEALQPSMAGLLTKAEIDIQIATAKQYPRSIKEFRRQAMEMATLDEDTASSMFYALPRGGKTLEGPSVRLAEVVGSAWGNIRYGSRVIEVGDKFITAQGVCFDLEKNVQAAVEVRRRITGRDGRRFNEDMITVTGNAAMSIALRNAVFKVVPFTYVKSVYEQAKLVAVGEGLPMGKRRERAFEFFKKLGATEAQILGLLGRPGLDDVNTDDLVTLTGLRTAIKDGDTSLEAVLGDVMKAQSNVVVTPGSLSPESLAGSTVKGENDAKRPEETKPEPPAEKPAETAPAPAPAPAAEPEKAPAKSKAKAKADAPAGVTDEEVEEASRLFK